MKGEWLSLSNDFESFLVTERSKLTVFLCDNADDFIFELFVDIICDKLAYQKLDFELLKVSFYFLHCFNLILTTFSSVVLCLVNHWLLVVLRLGSFLQTYSFGWEPLGHRALFFRDRPEFPHLIVVI